MLPQLSWGCDMFDISPGKPAKIDNLYILDLPMLHFAQQGTHTKNIAIMSPITPPQFL